jgi:broad specificity phosphatase PhoE
MPELHDIQPEDIDAIANHMATVHPDVINKGLGHLLTNRILSPQQAVDALGKVDKARENLAKTAPQAETPEAKPEPDQPEVGKDITESKEKQPESIIHPTDALKTWDMASLAGTPETDESQKEMKKVVSAGNIKAGGDGETFDEFRDRALPVLPDALKNAPDNSTLVTHSSVFKLYKTWESMGRPDPSNMNYVEKKKFADLYNDEETHTGDVEPFFEGAKKVYVARHGQTEDNLAGNYRKDDTNLTDKGVKQAIEAGQDIKQRLDGKPIPAIISSSLPRTIHTSQLIQAAANGPEISESGGGKTGKSKADEPKEPYPEAGQPGAPVPANPEDKAALDFTRNYVNSPMYQKRLSNFHSQPEMVQKARQQKLKDVSFTETQNSAGLPGGANTMYDDNSAFPNQVNMSPAQLDSIKSGRGEAAAHELGHLSNAGPSGDPMLKLNKDEEDYIISRNKTIKPADLQFLQKIKGDKSYSDIMEHNAVTHDQAPSESMSDIQALRFLMYKHKISDPGKEDATPETLKKAAQNPEIKGSLIWKRLHENFDDKGILDILNNVAMSNHKDDSNLA